MPLLIKLPIRYEIGNFIGYLILDPFYEIAHSYNVIRLVIQCPDIFQISNLK